MSEKPLTHLKLTPPPHNGVGKAWQVPKTGANGRQEEDSLLNCTMIQPKPLKVHMPRYRRRSHAEVDLERMLVYGGDALRASE